MSINKTVLFFLFISAIAFSQTKKKVDTIFVYEKVFVYKTISKTHKALQSVSFDSISKKNGSAVKEFRTAIVADTSFLKMRRASLKKDKKKKERFWVLQRYGISIQSLFSQEPGMQNYGAGLGLIATKNIYKRKLFLNLEFLFSKVFSSTETKSIDGYYITPDAVLYYQAKNVSTQQLNIPVSLSWKYKKFKPQLGLAFTQKQTNLDFASYKNNTTFSTVLKTSYKLTNNYIDFMYGIEYDLTKRISLMLRSKQTVVKMNNSNTAENLKRLEELHFFPNQVLLGMVYNFKK